MLTCDHQNSTTLLHDLLPLSLLLASHHEKGVYNFTNPGAISHNEVLSLYRDIVDPSFTWKNFTLEEQSHVIKAGRSNCMLSTGKLEGKMREYGVELGEMEIKGGMRRCFERMARGEGLSSEHESAPAKAMKGKGLWMGKENENETKNKHHFRGRVGGEMV